MKRNDIPAQAAFTASQFEKERDYWLEQLSGELQKSSFPYDFKKIVAGPRQMNQLEIEFSPQLSSKLMSFGGGKPHRLHMILTAGIVALLNKYSGNFDIIVGAPIYKQEIEGEFVNTVLVLRHRLQSQMSFRQLLLLVRQTIVDANKYQNYPLQTLFYKLNIPFDKYDFALFDTVVLLDNIHKKSYIDHINPNLYFQFNKTETKVLGTIHYNAALFLRETVSQIVRHFNTLLEQALFELDVELSSIELLSEVERKQLIHDFNDTEAKYPIEKTIHRLFEEVAEKYPQHIALLTEDQEITDLPPITYAELNGRANRMAASLKQRGIRPGVIVGLLVDRSWETITGILAILKAGGAYLPIDSEFPQKRIVSMLDDSRAPILLTSNSNLKNYSFTELQGMEVSHAGLHRTPSRPQIRDLDSLPIPDRSLVDYEKYSKYIGLSLFKDSISLQASRGCPYNCAYCHKIWPKKHVFRSAENIFEEVLLYYKKGVRRFSFVDDIFNLDVKNSVKFFELMIKHKIDAKLLFAAGLRGDILKKEYIDLMVEAGTVNVALALETASPRLQKIMGKNLNIDKIRDNIDYFCKKYPNVILDIFTMHGIPTETEEEAMMTLDFIKEQHWIHFPIVSILKIYPNTDMEALAVKNGISKQAIARSEHMAFHELPETLPFDKSFTLKYQSDYLNNYFLLKERLLHVLPYQMKLLTENEIVQKYDSYLPMDIRCFDDLLEFTGITRDELGTEQFYDEHKDRVPDLNARFQECFSQPKPVPGALNVLLLDLSQFFAHDEEMLYDVSEAPLGLIYTMTYLKRELGDKINGKIAKSRIDFDSYDELKRLLEEFKPHVIGIRTLTFYMDSFHQTVAMIRQWGFNVPIITGGPYATSDYGRILEDKNVDLVVMGEGEITFTEIISHMIDCNGQLPPEETLKQIQGIVFSPHSIRQAPMQLREIILFDALDKEVINHNPHAVNQPGDPAYVIFTSGSTGRPKGVMIEHRNVVRLMHNERHNFDFDTNDVWTMFHSHSFDFSVWEMYGALLYGGTLVVVPKMIARDPGEFLKVLKKNEVTVLNQTPSAFYNLIEEELKYEDKQLKLRYIIFGGEALSPEKLKEWHKKYPEVKLINMFGITETTVHVTFKEITANEINANISNIGTPIPTLQTYILDDKQNLLPIGVPGELCVGGDGVARGYLNAPLLTSEKFIENPFRKGERLYRSGDLARLLPNGEMEYLGRIDHQVQIRGFRVELGEIESQLLKHPNINEVLVITIENQNIMLCAYFISEIDLPATELREFLSANLPDYMVPNYFVRIERIPLTPNGKVDRKALADPIAKSGEHYVPPANELQERLAIIWQEVLGLERISIIESFFDVGGDSIKTIKLVSTINTRLNQKLRVVDLYTHETIEKFSRIIKTEDSAPIDKKYEEVLQDLEKFKSRILTTLKEVGTTNENIADIYPMSDIESGMLYASMKDTDQAVYHDQTIYQVEYPDFNPERFRKAFSLMVDKHAILRTCFNMHDYEAPCQIVYNQIELNVTHEDISADEPSRQHNQIQRYLEDERLNPFTLDKPLWRLTSFDLGLDRIVVIWTFHHAIIDGWSNASLMTELNNTYLKLKTDPEFIPQSLKSSYKDFVIQQVIDRKNPDINRYWQSKLQGYKRLEFPPVTSSLQLHAATESPGGTVYYTENLGTKLLKQLQDAAVKSNSTVKDLCFASYVYMMNILSFDSDITVGLVTNNRPACEDGDKILGCFLNTIPFRMNIPYNITWKAYIKLIHEKMVELKKYDSLSLFRIKKIVGEKSDDRNPIFDTMFNFIDFNVFSQAESSDNNADQLKKIGNKTRINRRKRKKLSLEGYANTNTLFDFTINTTFDQFLLSLPYDRTVVDSTLVKQLCGIFKEVLHRFISVPDSIAEKNNLLTEEERYRLTRKFNDTDTSYMLDSTLCQLLEARAGQKPDTIACQFKEHPDEMTLSISYRELNNNANRIAHSLREIGVESGTIVAIMIPRSPEMLYGILGIIKAGGVYLPLDPNYPNERVRFIMKDSASSVLMVSNRTTSERTFNLSGFEGAVLNIHDIPVDSSHQNPEHMPHPHQPVYVIYTSGSTGLPKGVLIKHKSVMNILYCLQDLYPLESDDVYLLKTNYTFDVSVTELFGWLFGEGKLQILPDGHEKDPDAIASTIDEFKITHINFVPSMLSSFLDTLQFEQTVSLRSMKYIFVAGEAFTPQLLEKLKRLKLPVRIENIFGPTEATIYSSKYSIDVEQTLEHIPIGHSIANIRNYILDNAGQLVPIGVPGELCNSGQGVAFGYLNRPELTAEKFTNDPFNEHSYVYRTGDLALWMQDGNILFLGRIDQQVKIRGFRIEPGEIESQFKNYQSIREAVVVPHQNNSGETALCGYFSAMESIDTALLREWLEKRLPAYMIPDHMMQIDTIPLTSSGKINRNQLPDPGITKSIETYIPPANETELILSSIWADVLDIKQECISVEDNFFKLGGHSLRATQLILKVHKQLQIKLSLETIFKANTIRSQAQTIKQQSDDTYIPIGKAPIKDYYPLSPAQKRMFALNVKNDTGISYNMPTIVTLSIQPNKEKLEEIFKLLIARHESLRTSFEVNDEEPVQYINNYVDFHVEVLDISNATPTTISETINSIIQPFDLSQAPLMRACLLLASGKPNIFILDMHHIITDGSSIGILFKEISVLYKGGTLPPLEIQYKDYALWLQSPERKKALKSQEEFWLKQLSDFKSKNPTLNLPTDFPRPKVQSYQGSSISFPINEKDTSALIELAVKEEATLFMVILAIFHLMLSRLSGQDTIAIGTGTAGRGHDQLQNTVGMFVNTIVLLNQLKEDTSFTSFLQTVKENTLKAFENQDYQFEDLVKKLGAGGDPGRNPLFDVLFEMQNTETFDATASNSETLFESHTSKFDLMLAATEINGQLTFTFQYCTKLFQQKTIQRYISYFLEIIDAILENPNQLIENIKISHQLFDQKLQLPEEEQGDFGF